VANTIQGIQAWRRDPDPEGGDTIAGPPDDPSAAARAARAAANDRYQAFVSSGPTDKECDDVSAPGHDYDQCVRAPISNPVLFEMQKADANAVDPKDVQQRGLGDCYFLASLAALASTPGGRALIGGAIVENKNDQGEVVSWTVTLHQPDKHLFGPTTFRDVHVQVSGLYVVGHAAPRVGDDGNEVWAPVFEKAYAQYAGGYEKIGHGGDPAKAMAILTGREATSVSLGWPERLFRSYGADELQRDLASGKMVVLNARAGVGRSPASSAIRAERQSTVDAHGLVGGHAYFVEGLEQRDGKQFVKLGNPWAASQPDPIPCDELTRWFARVSIGGVP
jgi:Calpain family cysteine protease